MLQQTIENFPKEIQKVVLKARSTAELAIQSFIIGIESEKKSLIAMQSAIVGDEKCRTCDWGDGYIYSGEWGKNTPNGYGIFEWTNGNLFEGFKGTISKQCYTNNDKNRYGIEWLANGDEPKMGKWGICLLIIK